MPESEDLKCTFPKFCHILAHFQPTQENTPEHLPNSGYSKAKLVFLLFDANNSGKISKVSFFSFFYEILLNFIKILLKLY